MNTHQYQYRVGGMELVVSGDSGSVSVHVGARDHNLARRLAMVAIEDRKREIALLQSYVDGDTRQII